ncbi:MAG: DUF4878 domain-containing protein [Tannerella sp.]|nr:DUF4878 domain-containing protein [Tannerella sp.]
MAVAILFGSLMFAACGGNSNSPSGIVKSAYTELQKGNYDKYFDIAIALTDRVSEDEKESYVNLITEVMEANGGLKSFEIQNEEISEDGLTATIEIKIVYGNGTDSTQKAKFEKKDGVWIAK